MFPNHAGGKVSLGMNCRPQAHRSRRRFQPRVRVRDCHVRYARHALVHHPLGRPPPSGLRPPREHRRNLGNNLLLPGHDPVQPAGSANEPLSERLLVDAFTMGVRCEQETIFT